MESKSKNIFVNGSFDIIHYGHISLLNYAKSLGNYLLVAIDTDSRIAEKKGPDRPFNNEFERKQLLLNLKAVNDVVVFNTDEELTQLIYSFKPDIMLVGSDWKFKKVIGSEYAKELIFFDRVYDESTTKKIENYINRRQLHR